MSQRDFVRQMPSSNRLQTGPTLWQKIHVDVPLLLMLLTLTGLGLVVLYSASGRSVESVQRQATFFAMAYGAMFLIAQMKMLTIKRWSVVFYALGLVLLVAVQIFGSHAKGAQRWLDLPGLPRFQPSEIMKVAVPLVVAWSISVGSVPPRPKAILVSLLLIAVPAALVVIQPDLGTAILVATSGVFVLLLSGLSWMYVLVALVIFGLSAYPIWHYGLYDYQRQRILTMLDPESDKLGAGWNIIQSKTAIGSGGWEGKGWLLGTQSHLDFLPESHTDFIIAVYSEEFGLFGVLCLLALYMCIIGRGLIISLRAQETYSRLVAGTLTLTFFVYVFVNMGMVSGLLPVVGVPLPLVSQGGTALITLFLGFGLLMAVSTEQRRRLQ